MPKVIELNGKQNNRLRARLHYPRKITVTTITYKTKALMHTKREQSQSILRRSASSLAALYPAPKLIIVATTHATNHTCLRPEDNKWNQKCRQGITQQAMKNENIRRRKEAGKLNSTLEQQRRLRLSVPWEILLKEKKDRRKMEYAAKKNAATDSRFPAVRCSVRTSS